MIDTEHPKIPVVRQCELLDIHRSGLYYEQVGVSAEDHELMGLLDKKYMKRPFYGVLRMKEWLETVGWCVGRGRVRRLLRQMGIEALYPKPRLSLGNKQHRRFPYLLRGVPIRRRDQVWSADITYIRLQHGFVYLVAILDWFSRYVLTWRLSNTLDADFCVEALKAALQTGKPEIFNTDQGAQFTSEDFLGPLEKAKVRISMDGRGRVFDNIFIERLWRTVKYEDVYLNDYETVPSVLNGLGQFFSFYNGERQHSSLDYLTPEQVYVRGLCPRGARA